MFINGVWEDGTYWLHSSAPWLVHGVHRFVCIKDGDALVGEHLCHCALAHPCNYREIILYSRDASSIPIEPVRPSLNGMACMITR